MEKLIFIRFVLHVVGDIHCPVHCTNLYNATFNNPDGDGDRFGTRQNILTP